MSDKLIIMLLLLSFNISAGELTWYTADKTYYMDNCELRGQSNSDLNNLNEYYLNCDQTPTSIFSSNSSTSRSIANVNGQYFLRCEADAIINSSTDFYLNFNCSDLISKNGFDL